MQRDDAGREIITVKTQAQYDKAEYETGRKGLDAQIIVKGAIEPVELHSRRKKQDQAAVIVDGYSGFKITAVENTVVKVTGNGRLTAKDGTTVFAGGAAEIEAHGDCKIFAENKTRVYGFDRAQVKAMDEAYVELHGQADIKAKDKVKVSLYEQASGRVSGEVEVHGDGNSFCVLDEGCCTGYFSGSARVESYGARIRLEGTVSATAHSGEVRADGMSHVFADKGARVDAYGEAMIRGKGLDTRLYVHSERVVASMNEGALAVSPEGAVISMQDAASFVVSRGALVKGLPERVLDERTNTAERFGENVRRLLGLPQFGGDSLFAAKALISAARPPQDTLMSKRLAELGGCDAASIRQATETLAKMENPIPAKKRSADGLGR
jgi:hypothetical protein